MTRPQKYLIRITLFLIPVGLLCAFLLSRLQDAFATNPGLNGLIAAVLLIGIVLSIRQVTMLSPAVKWIEKFRESETSEIPGDAPKLIAPMAAMMGERERKLSLSALSMRTILDGIAARMDEGREITRYFIGLLIFLGLLGTFWGLLGTIGSIKDTINNLTVGSNDIGVLFEDLKDGLAAPLGGMGTAFSSSLFGLAGSVVLGFIDLQAGQAQGRFFNDLEDWLSSVTKLSRGSSLAIEHGDGSVPAYVSALLEQSADSLENLHNVISNSEERRSEVNTAMLTLSEQLSTLSDSQTEMRSVLKQMLELFSSQISGESDKIQVKHLRNIDVQIKYLTEETIKGQNKFNDTLKSEFKLLARTLGAKVDRAPLVREEPAPPAPNETTESKAPEPDTPPKINLPTDDAMDYDMPTPKPKGNKKPILTTGKKLTARKDD
ncbi:MotA/TolQ/ExbB proton channel family protein, probably associated with flagella [hydrothermal vent metagenome]|uniref:MotA/TolQ/ExbB proton channel family protein, probably associated with flagella n=1 Tax=hydrothermal vent metagenome TaxID=652676 RepID=A0A3B0SWQ0_9ZZZZ